MAGPLSTCVMDHWAGAEQLRAPDLLAPPEKQDSTPQPTCHTGKVGAKAASGTFNPPCTHPGDTRRTARGPHGSRASQTCSGKQEGRQEPAPCHRAALCQVLT